MKACFGFDFMQFLKQAIIYGINSKQYHNYTTGSIYAFILTVI